MSFGFGFSLPAYAGYAASFGPSSFGAGTSLALDFLNGNNTLDPRITFSRTSNATLTNSAGVLTYAPHNLLTFSEQFDNAAWTKGTSTITANAEFAPNGTTTADFLKEDASPSSFHSCFRAFTFTAETYTFSCYAKLGVGSRGIQLRVRTAIGSGTIYANSSFNLSTGAVIGTPTGTPVATDVGNGWWRLSVSFAAAAGSIEAGILLCDASGNAIFNGDNTSGNYIWGAQLNVGALQPYYPTTVKNLLGYTQEFDNAAWTKSNTTVTANATTAPDGSLTADKLVENTANSEHYARQTVTVAAGTRVTFSYYVKTAERSSIRLRVLDAAAPANGFFGSVDASTGATAFGTAGTGTVTAPIAQNLGGGWYRLALTGVASSTAATLICDVFVLVGNQLSAAGYTGDGTSGIYIWGAQISDSASLDPYVYNPVAAPASTAYYGPRFDYDPVTLAPKGLLVEEQRTNLLTFSEDFDNAAYGKSAGTVTANAGVSPDGTSNADLVSSTGGGVFRAGVAVANTTAYTLSVYVKQTVGAGQFSVGFDANPANGRALFNLTNGTLVSNGASVTASSITPVGNGWFRCTVTATTTSTTTNLVFYNSTSGTAWLMYGAQLEAGAFATSYIPTTTAAATRAADVATMIGANFSNWYNQSEGTLFAEADTAKTSGPTPTITAQIAGGNDRHQLGMFTQTGATVNAGVVQSLIGVNTAQSAKLAYAYKANDFAAVSNGGSASTDTAGTVPASLTYTTLGKFDFGGGESINGHLRRISYYPRRLSNTELQSITA